ncbi:aldo/keto reductase [Rapidithrix thailandica]|uniref:Aldo/keto reductase n=1 Tax=Rapidithrix thailandica TaxID=413964 RepID=A0AAW9SE45_9BACT
MNYNTLGKSSLEVSEVSFGCMSLGDDHRENILLLQKALDQGINYFDTADIYQKGENEVSLGKAFKEKREQVIIATKVGNQPRPDGHGWDWNPSRDYILKSVEESLERLQTDYIDLYQLHGGTLEDPIDETIEAFERLIEQGKIRYYGISSIRPNVIREYAEHSNIVSVMMQYSLLDRRPEETCLPLLEQKQISVVTRGSLAKGLLVDKEPAPYLHHTSSDVQKAAEAVQALTDEKRGAAQIALKFVLQHPAVASAVVGIRTLEQLEDALKVTQSEGLSQQELQQLQEAIKPSLYELYR